MHVMKRIASLLLVATILLGIASCTEDEPRLRVRNDYSEKVNVQLKPSAGSTFNINDVGAGDESSFYNINEGAYEATASISGVSPSPKASFQINNGQQITLIITNTDPPEIQVKDEG